MKYVQEMTRNLSELMKSISFTVLLQNVNSQEMYTKHAG